VGPPLHHSRAHRAHFPWEAMSSAERHGIIATGDPTCALHGASSLHLCASSHARRCAQAVIAHNLWQLRHDAWLRRHRGSRPSGRGEGTAGDPVALDDDDEAGRVASSSGGVGSGGGGSTGVGDAESPPGGGGADDDDNEVTILGEDAEEPEPSLPAAPERPSNEELDLMSAVPLPPSSLIAPTT